jgi:hypothetical protein
MLKLKTHSGFHDLFPETTGPIGTKLCKNVPWMILYKVTVFRSSRIFNMAARANNNGNSSPGPLVQVN